MDVFLANISLTQRPQVTWDASYRSETRTTIRILASFQMYNNVPQNGNTPYYGAHHPSVVNPLGIPPPGSPFTMLLQVPPPMVLPEVPMSIPGYETTLQQAYYQGAMNLMNNMLPLQPTMRELLS